MTLFSFHEFLSGDRFFSPATIFFSLFADILLRILSDYRACTIHGLFSTHDSSATPGIYNVIFISRISFWRSYLLSFLRYPLENSFRLSSLYSPWILLHSWLLCNPWHLQRYFYFKNFFLEIVSSLFSPISSSEFFQTIELAQSTPLMILLQNLASSTLFSFHEFLSVDGLFFLFSDNQLRILLNYRQSSIVHTSPFQWISEFSVTSLLWISTPNISSLLNYSLPRKSNSTAIVFKWLLSFKCFSFKFLRI